MTDRTPRLFDVVALLRDVPESGLIRGQVGTVVDDANGELVLVEFANSEGETFASPSLARRDLLVLSYESVAAE